MTIVDDEYFIFVLCGWGYSMRSSQGVGAFDFVPPSKYNPLPLLPLMVVHDEFTHCICLHQSVS